MRILGVETSCDETAAAVVEDGTKIISNVVASSVNLHAKTGGIIPEQAARQQVVTIIPVIAQALAKAPEVDAIAVTVGPGLVGSLLVGIETAKSLASLWNKPLIPVNHLVGHIYANWLNKKSNVKSQMSKVPQFPALALVVSGGHTDLVIMENHGKLKWLGGTRDDAAGEAFDKTARLLGLAYPGGPAISAAAEKFITQNPNYKLNMFPRPMLDNFSSRGRPASGWDWSFSGLKTAVLREIKDKSLKIKDVQRLAAEIQEAIVEVLVVKTLRAANIYKPKSLLLAGGVAANNRLREKFEHEIKKRKMKISFHVPPVSLCTDNASYIASCAFFNFFPVGWKKVFANPQLTITGES